MNLRHFSEISEEEMRTMSERMELAAVAYAEEIGMAGLSHLGVHNIYTMVQEGLRKEWKRSKKIWGAIP